MCDRRLLLLVPLLRGGATWPCFFDGRVADCARWFWGAAYIERGVRALFEAARVLRETRGGLPLPKPPTDTSTWPR